MQALNYRQRPACSRAPLVLKASSHCLLQFTRAGHPDFPDSNKSLPRRHPKMGRNTTKNAFSKNGISTEDNRESGCDLVSFSPYVFCATVVPSKYEVWLKSASMTTTLVSHQFLMFNSGFKTRSPITHRRMKEMV